MQEVPLYNLSFKSNQLVSLVQARQAAYQCKPGELLALNAPRKATLSGNKARGFQANAISPWASSHS